MKEKIIMFLIGLMTGAIIATGAIFVYTLAAGNNGQSGMQMQDGNQMQNQGANGGPNGQMGTPPEMPNNQGQQAN